MSAVERVDPTQGWGGRLAGEHGPGGFPLNASTDGALVAVFLARSGAGSLYSLTGFNSGAQTFVLIFDSTLGVAIANGAQPKVIINAPALQSFSLTYGLVGRAFPRGITVASSSTSATLTATAAVCSFDVQHG